MTFLLVLYIYHPPPHCVCLFFLPCPVHLRFIVYLLWLDPPVHGQELMGVGSERPHLC